MAESLMQRLVGALERLAPQAVVLSVLERGGFGFQWYGSGGLEARSEVGALPLGLLLAVDDQKQALLANTRQFAGGYGANNALLWGARGTGKSSLVKSVCLEVHREHPELCLIEVPRGEMASLPVLLRVLSATRRRCVLFCDDLSFEPEEQAYKSLKSLLDGGLLESSSRVLFYATSNRRHLVTREISENEMQASIFQGELRDERLSLTDRFGLWIGFHRIDQQAFLAMIGQYANHFDLPWSESVAENRAEALRWFRQRGARSGRVAWQYICDLAGRHRKKVSFPVGEDWGG